MNTILVPTDFSAVAANALKAAKHLAKKSNAAIHLVHFYQLPLADYSNPDMLLPTEILEHHKHEANVALQNLVASLKEEGFDADASLKFGLLTEEIESLASSLNSMMIVMGTTGASNIVNKLIGSNAANVLQHTEHPILLIPSNCHCDSFSNIVYLAELKEDDTEVLSKVFAFAEMVNALHVRLLNVNTGFFFTPINEHLMIQLNRAFGLKRIKMDTVDGADLVEGIEHYLENHHVNLLVMSTHKKSFLSRLFGKNDTIKMAQYTKVPLLVYHK
ncbi:MAG TPA: universal stress protein [Chitinophagales bacterium]|nr:universal stress protein [Chitinophagales bacterium]HMW12431.1 universal stress protein [Chitinophagales bacterium]HMX59742.1 universal stress protein [Chitinophagales bacterium]HMY23164.1 universal stress protein [Chitinophagales bacterium]HMZ33398.1 universal stress protein [Chitinophagales bacterium]